MERKWFKSGWFVGGVVGAVVSIVLIIQFYLGLSSNSENIAINLFGIASYLLISLTNVNEMGNVGVFFLLLSSSFLLIVFFILIGGAIDKLIIKKQK